MKVKNFGYTIEIANSKEEALQLRVNEFDLPMEDLKVFDVSKKAEKDNIASVLGTYYW